MNESDCAEEGKTAFVTFNIKPNVRQFSGQQWSGNLTEERKMCLYGM